MCNFDDFIIIPFWFVICLLSLNKYGLLINGSWKSSHHRPEDAINRIGLLTFRLGQLLLLLYLLMLCWWCSRSSDVALMLCWWCSARVMWHWCFADDARLEWCGTHALIDDALLMLGSSDVALMLWWCFTDDRLEWCGTDALMMLYWCSALVMWHWCFDDT